jgi:hypothetical protein
LQTECQVKDKCGTMKTALGLEAGNILCVGGRF